MSLFRVWDTMHETMEYIDDLYWFKENGVHDLSGKGHCGNYIIMWNTGFKDKRGNYIYDGDILETKTRYTSVVLHRQVGCWDCSFISYKYGKAETEELEPRRWKVCSNIVGNIYESEYLLKVITR